MPASSDPSYPRHVWTIRVAGGDWGVVGYRQAQYRARGTAFWYGSGFYFVECSLYAIVGFAACFGVAAIGFATAAVRRDHDNAA